MSDKNRITEKGVFQFSAVDVFNVVIDVEKYPEFLPWCKNVKIISNEKGSMVADTVISFKRIEASYNSVITYCAPDGLNFGYVAVKSTEGVFTTLVNSWKFIPQNHSSTLVEFDIDFQLRSTFMQSLLNIMYKRAQREVVKSFYNRVRKICQK